MQTLNANSVQQRKQTKQHSTVHTARRQQEITANIPLILVPILTFNTTWDGSVTTTAGIEMPLRGFCEKIGRISVQIYAPESVLSLPSRPVPHTHQNRRDVVWVTTRILSGSVRRVCVYFIVHRWGGNQMRANFLARRPIVGGASDIR